MEMTKSKEPQVIYTITELLPGNKCMVETSFPNSKIKHYGVCKMDSGLENISLPYVIPMSD